ncbi:I78 family peptidase inhibitor [Vulcaniibacterium tengchongense]|uniref:Peptidase inhibitor I78 family protein n=1 Tax=Vulcaniibacterium tengchongense TaxID=1273429 RepID=A0A3N4VB31_9GAMM|nr:I78 family peptidase inhibitor [Vulcaniibacterium tengchongense]RPE80192.1 peptidase inhibitor I78 family protein [Vulcaniibacterium tengchongense]
MLAIRSLFASTLSLVLFGCASAPPPTADARPPSGVCNAEGARWAIGQGVNDEVVNRILRDTGSRDARVLRPGQPATMDYREDRINVDVNDRGAITGLRCG